MGEKEIIAGCRNGDRKAQKALTERYSPMLFTVARRYCSQDQDAADVLQDALIRILKGLQKNYREEGKFERWLRTVVITTALNALDKAKLKHEHPVDEIPFDAGAPPEAYAHLGAEALMKLIQALPDGYREVFNLYVIEGCTHREISAMLHISEGTSRSQLMRARLMLQKMIMKNESIRL